MDSDVFEHQGRWRCLETHSSLSGGSREQALELLNGALQAFRKGLGRTSHAVITVGSAYGYTHLKSGKMVANCHKLPAREFERVLSPVAALEESLRNSLELLRAFNNEMTILFTVSPVRHVRDGLVANQRSKAHLISAVQALVASGKAEYIPAYELFMDELRDYRYYASDLIHPTEQAVDYAWERFGDAWVDPEDRAVMEEVAAIRKGLSHRPLFGETPAHLAFRETLKGRIAGLARKYPHMVFEDSPAD
jgi:hypothetical protein